jgi:signal transduction histidine kinase
LITLQHRISRFSGKPGLAALLVIACGCFFRLNAGAQPPVSTAVSPPKRVLMIFSEARDLPGNVMMEQAVRAGMTAGGTNRIDFFTESLDASRFPTPRHYRVFRNYIENKYAGQNLDAAILFLSRDFLLLRALPATIASNVPSVVVSVNDMDSPDLPSGPPVTGIIQRFDVQGTVKFIFQLQPETRKVVVIGGISPADQATLARISECARSLEGIDFEFWTNRPVAAIYEDAKKLPEDTVILLSSVQRDVTGQSYYTAQIVRTLAPQANVPVYVLGNALIGTGALGGDVIDFEELGASVGKLASRILAGTHPSDVPIEVRSNGVPTVDWRAMQRWHIKSSQLTPNCVVRYRPRTVFEEHWRLFLLIAAAFLAQAITIAALLMQRERQKHAEAEILRQRTELTHVSRVSMLGQLASALTHELNQPLGAILRNAEAADVYLRGETPDLAEVRAILTDIRRDDKRAGNVIDRMRSLFKRQQLTLGPLDLQDLLDDTIAMIRPDAAARQVKLRAITPPHLPSARGDRVHIQQILLNLIFNGMDAMKTTPPQRRMITVEINKTHNDNLRVIVKDRGTGIGPDDAEHVFEPFFTTKSNGMGMGLAISKTIIEAHGGEIWMTSSGTDGTTFTFLLPQAGAEKIKAGDLPAGVGSLS